MRPPPPEQESTRIGGGWWWGGNVDRGDSARLEAFSDGVLAIAITLLILDVRVHLAPGESPADGLRHALPAMLAYTASFLQISIMWANHHALFRVVDRVDQLLLLANLLLLACVSFLPFPTTLVAEHTSGPDARTAMLLYGGTLTACAVAFNLIWWHASRRLLTAGVTDAFRRDVSIRYLAGLAGYLAATMLALVQPWLTLAATALLRSCSSSGHHPAPPPIDRGQRVRADVWQPNFLRLRRAPDRDGFDPAAPFAQADPSAAWLASPSIARPLWSNSF